MKRQSELEALLVELGKAHRRIHAPASVETALRRAVGSRRPAAWRLVWAIPALVACAALILLLSNPHRIAPTYRPQPEYAAIPSAEALPPPTTTSILRVQLRKEDLREYGFDVPVTGADETILADFEVGEDGLARAIRFSQ